MTLHRRALLQTALLSSALAFAPKALAQAVAEDPLLAGVNPEFKPFLTPILPYFRNAPAVTRETLIQARQRFPIGAPLPDVPYEQMLIPGAAGQPDVTVFVVNAAAQGARPAILYTHGGGFVFGSARASLPGVQEICKALGCAAVTVEYRLAPETTYRGSIEDNYAALKWLHANAASLGVNPERLAVMGESAGGGHAALLAITARDRGEVPLVFQSLIYPMLDDRTGTSRRMPPQVGHLIWTAEQNRFGWASFLGAEPGGRSAPRGAVPAREANLTGLPPAFIGVGSIDLFCDEDIDYARRLNDVGVPAELIVVPGGFHGFDGIATSSIVQQFNAAKIAALKRGLGIVASN